MPSNGNHDAHDYAERIRERLPSRLHELRERCGLSKYGLARESGLSRNACGSVMLVKKLSGWTWVTWQDDDNFWQN